MNPQWIRVAYGGTELAYWALLHAADGRSDRRGDRPCPLLANVVGHAAQILRDHDFEPALYTLA